MFFYTRSQEIKDRACQHIQELNGVWRINIHQPKRSLAQNDYMHVLFDEIAPHTPLSSDGLKEWMKGKLLGVEMVEMNGEAYPKARKTSELTKGECTLFIEQLLMMADEYQIQLKNKGFWGIT